MREAVEATDLIEHFLRPLSAPAFTIATAINGVDAEDYPALVEEPEIPTIRWVGRIDPLRTWSLRSGPWRGSSRVCRTRGCACSAPRPRIDRLYERRIPDLVEEIVLADSVTFENRPGRVTTAYQSSTVVALSSSSEGVAVHRHGGDGERPGHPSRPTSAACPRCPTMRATGVRPRDPDAFAEPCAQLLLDDDRRRRTATAARALEL